MNFKPILNRLRAFNGRRALQRGFFMINPFITVPPPATPILVSSTHNSIGSVSNGNLVVLCFLATGAAVAAPTGWTRVLNTTDLNGYFVAIYWSIYSGSNAVANTTNFPVGLGDFYTLVYTGATTIAQIGTLTDTSGLSVTAAALTNPTAPGGALLAFVNSRDPNAIIASTESMSRRYTFAASFFIQEAYESLGSYNGTRTFTRTVGTLNNLFAVLFEIA